MEVHEADSQELEETEPIEIDDGFFSRSQSQEESQSQSQAEYWGRLYPLKATLPVIDLVQNSVTFGKRNASFIVSKQHLPVGVLRKCSGLQFEIQRQQKQQLGAMVTQIVIIDKSSNGTFINGHSLKRKPNGPMKYKTLKSHDIIGLPAGNPNIYDAYVFINPCDSSPVSVPRLVSKKFQLSMRLGVGAFGEVSLVFDKEKGKPYAMKTIVKDRNTHGRELDSQRQKLLNELRILQTVDHPNVIKLVDVVDCKRERYLILEYMEGKDLSHRLQDSEKFDEGLSKFYMYQIAKGVDYLHKQGITHRDLKPANILLASSEEETVLKITDFGLSKIVSSATMMKTLCGTKMYVAPEILFGGGTYKYTQLVDVWSMGVLLYYCLSGYEPFTDESIDVEYLIKEAIFSMPPQSWLEISSEAQSIIRRMLTKDPSDRIKVHEILEDSWMQDDLMLQKVHAVYNRFARLQNSSSMSFSNSSLTESEGLSQDTTEVFSCPTSPAPKRTRLE